MFNEYNERRASVLCCLNNVHNTIMAECPAASLVCSFLFFFLANPIPIHGLYSGLSRSECISVRVYLGGLSASRFERTWEITIRPATASRGLDSALEILVSEIFVEFSRVVFEYAHVE